MQQAIYLGCFVCGMLMGLALGFLAGQLANNDE